MSVCTKKTKVYHVTVFEIHKHFAFTMSVILYTKGISLKLHNGIYWEATIYTSHILVDS